MPRLHKVACDCFVLPSDLLLMSFITGDVRVAFRLCLKASPSAKPFIRKLVLFTRKFWFILPVNKTDFHMKGFALGLACERQLGNRQGNLSWFVTYF